MPETCLPCGEVKVSDNGSAITAQPKFNPKLSLLGHGPHGKQVVDHLLAEYGEDGIRQFCQRWRQVFVAAIQPRFLPAGWDVNHRYTELLNLNSKLQNRSTYARLFYANISCLI